MWMVVIFSLNLFIIEVVVPYCLYMTTFLFCLFVRSFWGELWLWLHWCAFRQSSWCLKKHQWGGILYIRQHWQNWGSNLKWKILENNPYHIEWSKRYITWNLLSLLHFSWYGLNSEVYCQLIYRANGNLAVLIALGVMVRDATVEQMQTRWDYLSWRGRRWEEKTQCK